jgi:hypothetical protein
MTKMSLKIDGNEIHTSNFNTSVASEYLKGRNDVVVEFTSIYDQANAYVDDVIDDMLVNEDVKDIELAPLSSVTGDISYTCSGFPVSIDWDFNDDDKPEINASFRINSLFKGTDGSGIPLVIPFIIS